MIVGCLHAKFGFGQGNFQSVEDDGDMRRRNMQLEP